MKVTYQMCILHMRKYTRIIAEVIVGLIYIKIIIEVNFHLTLTGLSNLHPNISSTITTKLSQSFITIFIKYTKANTKMDLD